MSTNARPDILRRIGERREKLAALESLLRDPDLADVVREFGLSLNGNAPILVHPEKLHRPKGTAPNATGLKDAILEVSTTFGSLFTASMVVAKLQERHFKFDRKPLDAVRDSLYTIVKKELGICEAGSPKPGAPKYYERTDGGLRKPRDILGDVNP